MDRIEKIKKVESLVNGEKPEFIKVVHGGKVVGLIENNTSVTVEADTVEAAETLLRLRGQLK